MRAPPLRPHLDLAPHSNAAHLRPLSIPRIADYNDTHGTAHSVLSGTICRLKSGQLYAQRIIAGLASSDAVTAAAAAGVAVRGAVAGRPLLLLQPGNLPVGEFIPSSLSPVEGAWWDGPGPVELAQCLTRLERERQQVITIHQV